MASAKLPPPQKPKAASSTSEFTLPPILRPLLEDNLKKIHKPSKVASPGPNKKKRHGQAKLQNKEANFRETAERFPEAKELMNMKLKDYAYKDPSSALDPHKPARQVGSEIPSAVKNIEHTYSKKLKKQFTASIERVGKEKGKTMT